MCLVARHYGVLEQGQGWNSPPDLLYQEVVEIQVLSYGFKMIVDLQVLRHVDDRM